MADIGPDKEEILMRMGVDLSRMEHQKKETSLNILTKRKEIQNFERSLTDLDAAISKKKKEIAEFEETLK
jgi:hypothetical protein